MSICLIVVWTGAIKWAVFAGVSATIFVVATEVLLPSNTSFKFLCGGTVVLFVVLTSIINHVRMFISVRAHRNEVLGVTVSNQQRAVILRREKTVANHVMILSAALLICVFLEGYLKRFSHHSFNYILTCFHGPCHSRSWMLLLIRSLIFCGTKNYEMR